MERVTTDSNGEFELTSGVDTASCSGGSQTEAKELKPVFPPGDPRRDLVGFNYGDWASKAKIPYTPARRLDYPVHGKP